MQAITTKLISWLRLIYCCPYWFHSIWYLTLDTQVPPPNSEFSTHHSAISPSTLASLCLSPQWYQTHSLFLWRTQRKCLHSWTQLTFWVLPTSFRFLLVFSSNTFQRLLFAYCILTCCLLGSSHDILRNDSKF